MVCRCCEWYVTQWYVGVVNEEGHAMVCRCCEWYVTQWYVGVVNLEGHTTCDSLLA